MKFEIKLSGSITETRDYELTLQLNADNEDEASSLAMEQAQQASAPWQLDTSTLNVGTLPSDIEVESVKLLEEWKLKASTLTQKLKSEAPRKEN